MNTFFTSDLHLGHEGVIGFTHRPFKSLEEMHQVIIHNWRQRVKNDDVVYHLGDFCFKGGRQGGKTKAKIWEEKLTGKIVHIAGNHDDNNSTKALITNAIMKFGGSVVLAQHEPPTMEAEIPEFVDFVLCGHVHNLWKCQIFNDTRNEKIPIPIINVGIDVWNYRPVSLIEILAFYTKVKKEFK